MKILFTLFISLVFSISWAQKMQLNNVLVVGQFDKPEDRYSIENNLTEIFDVNGVKAKPSLNFLKYGGNAQDLATDSLTQLLKTKGIDTYVIVSIRGYDHRFKKSTHSVDLKTILGEGNIFPIYREEATSVTFEFAFYRNGKLIGDDIIKCGGVSSRDEVIKKLKKHLGKRVETYRK